MLRFILILGIVFISKQYLSQSFIYFEKNSDNLNSYSKIKLDSLSFAIQKSNPLEEINLRGHTDADAGEQFNKFLSLKRAKAVKDYFVCKGLNNRIHIDSKGETELLNTGKVESDKAKNRRVEIIRSFSENSLVFNKFEKEYQVYTINSKKDTILQCEFGAKIKVNKNSIETSGDSSKVILKVQEFTSKKDFILSNLTTQDINNALLESRGMINIEAYQGNKRVKLKTNQDISILFKDKSENDNMQIFNGINHNDQVIWNTSTSKSGTIVTQGNSVTSISGERISESKWKYEIINGKNMKISETIENGKKVHDTVSVESEKLVNDLWLTSNKFGWINCDRFYKYNSPKVDIIVKYSGSFAPNVVAVFKEINSILSYSYREDNKLIFKNIPAGLEISFVGIHGSKEKEKILFAKKKTVSKKDLEEYLIFEELMPDDIANKINEL